MRRHFRVVLFTIRALDLATLHFLFFFGYGVPARQVLGEEERFTLANDKWIAGMG